MDRKVFRDPDVIAEASRFVAVKANCTDPNSKEARIKNSTYQSPFMPYFVFIDSRGNYLPDLSIAGKASKETFLDHLRKVR
jgi:thiol:disulfide interchange protein